MNFKIKHLLILSLLTIGLTGCNSNDDLFTLDTPEDTIKLTSVPNSAIMLSQDKANDNAVVFTWNEATNLRAPQVDYYFKMGMEGNMDMTTDTIRLIAGQNSLTMTHAQLNRMLTNWNAKAGVPTTIKASVIAIPRGTAAYEKPEISKVTLEVTPYEQPKNALFICGTANPSGSKPVNAIRMDEGLDNTYTWTGYLQSGKLRFTLDQISEYPAYVSGGNDYTLKYDELGTDSATSSFLVNTDGLYTISADLEDKSVTISKTNVNSIWMVGDALPYGWNISQMASMKANGTNEFVYEGPLYAGDIKFPLVNNDKFEVPYLMAQKPDNELLGTTNFDYITAAQSANHDYKWHISFSGDYKLTINLDKRTLTCEKTDLSGEYGKFLESQRIIDNHFKLYMVGDATPKGWDITNATAMYYNAAVDPDCFIWEGRLSKGEVKLPFFSNGRFEVPYFMAASVGETPSDKGNDLTFVDGSKDGNTDRKWYILTSGYYQVKVNLAKRKIYFILDKTK